MPVTDGTSVLVAESEADESAYSRGTTEADGEDDDINLNDLLIHVLDTGASDLHLTSGARPRCGSTASSSSSRTSRS